MRDYQKSVKNDPLAGSYKPVSFDEDNTDSQEVGKFVKHPDFLEKEDASIKGETQELKKKDPFLKAKEKYNKVKQEKLEKQQQIEKAREEKRQKLEEYKKKKQERFKKLSKKTKKGQPVMTGRLELLLEQIQKSSK
uniref:rRNA-processing protein FYV7 n=2 Tax=Pectinophora gossypiella TaxID=13191 RepID=A0A1E1WEG8_PECGO